MELDEYRQLTKAPAPGEAHLSMTSAQYVEMQKTGKLPQPRSNKPKKKAADEPKIEDVLDVQLRCAGITEFEREYRFYRPRRWRFDFAFPTLGVYAWSECIEINGLRLAVEIEGITAVEETKNGKHTPGGHQTTDGFKKDIEKYTRAMLEGWWLYRCTPEDVRRGIALDTILKVLGRDFDERK